jgi:RNA polymerase sigma-70 factor (ECF subfamily)
VIDDRTRRAVLAWTLVQPRIAAFIAAMVRDFADRDDVLQDVALAVLESFERYDPERPFAAWAMRIAQHQVYRYLRRVRRDRHVFDEATADLLGAALVALEPAELRGLDHLRACVEELPREARELCELRYREELKPAAIAAKLGRNANGIAKALQRVRERLRECIDRKSAAEGAA